MYNNFEQTGYKNPFPTCECCKTPQAHTHSIATTIIWELWRSVIG